MDREKIEALLAAMEGDHNFDQEAVRLYRSIFAQLHPDNYLAAAIMIERGAHPSPFEAELSRYRQFYQDSKQQTVPLAELKSSWNLEAIELILRGLSTTDDTGLSFKEIVSVLETFGLIGRKSQEQYTPEEAAQQAQLYADQDNWGEIQDFHGRSHRIYQGPAIRKLHTISFDDRDVRTILQLMTNQGDIVRQRDGRYTLVSTN